MKNEEGLQKKQEIEDNIKKEAEEREKAKKYMPNRDNLRLKVIAQYRALKDGDVLQYQAIDKRMCERPSLKQLALRSDSIERMDRLKDLGFLDSQNLSMQDSKMYDSDTTKQQAKALKK